MKRLLLLLFTALLLLSLTACRSRTTSMETPDAAFSRRERYAGYTGRHASLRGSGTSKHRQHPRPGRADRGQSGGPDARTFSDTADAELTPDAENALAGTGQGENAVGHNGEQEKSGAAEAPDAPQDATETVGAENAEKTGADEAGKTADSSLNYYETLLADRLGSLFECQRFLCLLGDCGGSCYRA